MQIAPLKKLSINYFYFGFLLIILGWLHIFHLNIIEPENKTLKGILIIDAILQCFLEVGVLLLIWDLIKDRFSKFVCFIFIEFTFLLFVAHLIDFPLVRIMGMSIWFGIELVFHESFENFVEMLRVTNVSFTIWAVSAGVIVLLLLSGLLFFCFTEKLIKKKPLLLSYPSFLKIFGSVMALLLFWDIVQPNFSSSNDGEEYCKSLPWKQTLLLPRQETLAVSPLLKKPASPQSVFIDQHSIDEKKKPDIFLFVIESLREDFIKADISPNFYQFKKENIAFDLALSNANATQNSWFSLFYSQYPFYYLHDYSLWNTGSPTLILLKKLGYEIHVYSSSPFSYYKMDELLFGKNHHLADQFHQFSGETRWKLDDALMSQLQQKLQEEKSGGRLFLIFLESTHFDYSWPQDKPLVFKPIVDKINYITTAFSKGNLESIKNRYRNAMNYVDSLFGSFQQTLKEIGKWDESVIILTSDHGEEFYEQGHIFHASNLSHVQTHIPLYYKFGKNDLNMKVACSMTSHMDIFPTLFHYLLGENRFQEYFQGESIFKEERWPFTVVGRYNASRSPYEFYIHNGTYKLTARFNNEKKIFKARRLRLLSVKDLQDKKVSYNPAFIETEFSQAIHNLFP